MQNPVICNLAEKEANNAWVARGSVVKKIYQNNMESLQSHIVSVCQKNIFGKCKQENRWQLALFGLIYTGCNVVLFHRWNLQIIDATYPNSECTG